ncbi:MAG TPA: hypothetical protein VGO11_23690 [Chthoniobacteraceae bacterium]|jgi:5-methylcytosine-specific restriction enzyme subunit McrC|nr:hypothetical protein [Chthoniobacteraceae bacterium]
MRDPIPIQNVFYLLTYAWDFLPEGEGIDVSPESCPDLVNLFAAIFAGGMRQLVARGLDRAYVDRTEETALLRGRIDFGESNKRRSQWRARMVCTFDELSQDVLHNRILRTTLDRLLALPEVTAENRRALHVGREWFAQVRPVRLASALFRRVQLHRNNRHYRLLLNICELLYKALLPTEEAGSVRFRDFIRDERVMPRLFEKFVLHFARRHCRGAMVHAKCIAWNGWAESEEARALLPGMRTDVTLEWADRKLIVDCKFYREALLERGEKRGLHSGHLYQLHAYVMNQASVAGWQDCEGMLLYPAVAHRLDHCYVIAGHRWRVASVDLDQSWPKIEDELKERLGLLADSDAINAGQ